MIRQKIEKITEDMKREAAEHRTAAKDLVMNDPSDQEMEDAGAHHAAANVISYYRAALLSELNRCAPEPDYPDFSAFGGFREISSMVLARQMVEAVIAMRRDHPPGSVFYTLRDHPPDSSSLRTLTFWHPGKGELVVVVHSDEWAQVRCGDQVVRDLVVYEPESLLAELVGDQNSDALTATMKSAVQVVSALVDAAPFSSGGLPPSPKCEHDVEQRWCNNSRASDGRLCADIQADLDLQRYQTGERALCSPYDDDRRVPTRRCSGHTV